MSLRSYDCEEQGVLLTEASEMHPGNCSRLHHELAGRALRWAANRLKLGGVGCVEFNAWLALRPYDALAFGIAIDRYKYLAGIHGVAEGPMFFTFEVKVSRADLMAGLKKGQFHAFERPGAPFLVLPWSLATIKGSGGRPSPLLQRVPDAWGVLAAYGTGLRVIRCARYGEGEGARGAALVLRMAQEQWRTEAPWLAPCPDCGRSGGTRTRYGEGKE